MWKPVLTAVGPFAQAARSSRRLHRLLTAPAAILCVALTGPSAWAWPSDPDPRSVGAAGALAPRNGWAGAVLTSPALIPNEGRLSLHGGLVVDQRALETALDENDGGAKTKLKSVTPARLPWWIAVSGRLFSKAFSATIGYFTLADVQAEFGEDFTAHRYLFSKTRWRKSTWVLAGSWNGLGRRLGVGLALAAVAVELVHGRTLWVGTTAADLDRPMEDTTRDLGFRVRLKDPFVPALSAGAYAAPIPPLMVWLGITAVGQARLNGTFSLDPRGGDHLLGMDGNGRTARWKLNLPVALAGGVTVRLPRWTIGAAVRYERTSGGERPARLSPVDLTPSSTGPTVRFDSATMPAVYPLNSVTLSTGLEVEVLKNLLRLRAGAAHSHNYPSNTVCSELRPPGGLHLAAGLSVRAGRFRFHAAYGGSLAQTDCPVETAAAPNPLGGPVRIVPARTVRRSGHVVALSVEVSLPATWK